MSESMPYGEKVQELIYLRAKYEQFIIDRERERIIELIKDTYNNDELNETGSFVWTGDIIELISK